MPNSLSTADVEDLWMYHFAELTESSEMSTLRLMDGIKSHVFSADTVIAPRNALCEHYLLVAQGSVRIQLVTESGREVTLYRVQPGDGCILTTSCMISQQRFPAEGITESEVVAFTLNQSTFNRCLDQSAMFRQFVFENLGQRLVDVLSRIDQIYSPAVDQALASLLLKLHHDKAPIHKTHQDLALEMGMARETISRHLKCFERQGWIQLGRNTIELIDVAALSELAAG